MSLAQAIWALMTARYCGYGRLSGCTASGLVAVGTRVGECLALSQLWDRHSWARRCGRAGKVRHQCHSRGSQPHPKGQPRVACLASGLPGAWSQSLALQPHAG